MIYSGVTASTQNFFSRDGIIDLISKARGASVYWDQERKYVDKRYKWAGIILETLMDVNREIAEVYFDVKNGLSIFHYIEFRNNPDKYYIIPFWTAEASHKTEGDLWVTDRISHIEFFLCNDPPLDFRLHITSDLVPIREDYLPSRVTYETLRR